MSRYARQTCLAEVGETGQAKLASARVLVVGAGGLGATLLPLLVGAGIGHLQIVDGDTVEQSNLHRQTLFRMTDIGGFKAEVAAQALSSLNPDCQITALARHLDPYSARDVVAGADIVIDAADAFALSYALSDLCSAAQKPFLSASVLGRTGYAGGFCGRAPSLRAVFPDLPPNLQTCASAGVMGPAVAALGALLAQMCLSVILGHTPSALGQFISVDLQNWRFSGFRFDDAPEPLSVFPAIIGQANIIPTDRVFDLRDQAEAPLIAVKGAVRLNQQEIQHIAPETGRRVVLVCASGLRAWRAAHELSARGIPDIAILAAPL
jgi:sulfur-carrier protein adenylyltransferase/sulfurtransferase